MFEKLGQKIISHYEKKATCDCNSADESSKEIKNSTKGEIKNETIKKSCCKTGTNGSKCC